MDCVAPEASWWAPAADCWRYPARVWSPVADCAAPSASCLPPVASCAVLDAIDGAPFTPVFTAASSPLAPCASPAAEYVRDGCWPAAGAVALCCAEISAVSWSHAAD